MRCRLRLHTHRVRATAVLGVPSGMLPQYGEDTAGEKGGRGGCQREGSRYADRDSESLVSLIQLLLTITY